MKFARNEIPLLAVPLVAFVLSIWMMGVRGPYELGLNIDPEYVDLFNSVNLATGKPSFYFQHPATTMQILSVAVIRVKWLAGGVAGGWDPLPLAVLRDHLGYLRAINLVQVLLLGAVIFLSGRAVLRCSHSLAAALVTQLTPLLFLTPVEALPRVAPELLEVVFGLALMIPLAPILFGDQAEAAARNPRLAMAAGAVLACGIATKTLFVSLGLFVLLFPGWRQKLRFVLAAGVSLGFLLVPIAPSWRDAVSLYAGYLSGAGGGQPSESFLSAAAGAVKTSFTEEPFLYLLLAYFLVLLLVLTVTSGGERTPRRALYRRVILIGVIIVAAHPVMLARHFSYHYIVPALLAAIPLNAVAVRILETAPLGRVLRLVLVVLLVWIGYEGLRRNVFRMQWYAGWRAEYASQIAALGEKRDSLSGCKVAGYFRSSAPGYAEFWGNGLAYGLQKQAVTQLYPGLISYSIFDQEFVNADFEKSDDAVRREVTGGGCVLLQGEVANRPEIKGFWLEEVYVPEHRVHGSEGLYRLRLDAVPQSAGSAAGPDV